MSQYEMKVGQAHLFFFKKQTNFHIYGYTGFETVTFKCYGNVKDNITNILVYHMSFYD